MAERFDLAIAGAGFAGLVAARRAAQRGLHTIVLERKDEPGRPLHTTGILVKEAFDLLAAQYGGIPADLWRAVPGVRLYAPSGRSTDLYSPGYQFYLTDTPGLLRWLAREAERAGAEVRYAAPLQKARQTESSVEIGAGGAALEAAWLVGADGAKSAVAEAFGLGRNRRVLVGIEAEYSDVKGVDPNLLHTFLDRALAPGYIAWVAAGVGVTQVGIAARRADKPEFEAFLARVKALFDFRTATLAERRSGVIPVGGVVRPAAAGRVLLIGDAAGTVSPLTAGGIFTALDFGTRAADAIADRLAGRGPDPALTLPRQYPKYRAKRWLRRALDLGPPNWLVNLLIGTRPMQSFARVVYFHSKGLSSKAAWKDMVRRENT
jgi:flavin-dependent dehydrogenase